MAKGTSAAEATRRKLEKAFLELCAEKGASTVTVGAIAKRAGCNRCTFYNYFDSVDDMLDGIEDELVSRVEKQCAAIFANGAPHDYEEVFSRMFVVYTSIWEPMYILLGINGDMALKNKFYQVVYPYQKVLLGDKLDAQTLEYITAFIYSASIGLGEQWFRTKKDIPAEKFLQLSKSLVFGGVHGTIQAEGA